MILGVHHVQITIPKGAEEEGRAFYCGLLGLKEIDKPTSLQGRGGFWLKVGAADVHIGTENDVEREKTKAHIAYLVNDLAFWRQRLMDAGIALIESEPIPGFDRFECRDPFANRIELIQSTQA